YSVAEGLAGRHILTLLEDKEGNIWIGTTRGLSCFKEGEFSTFRKADGLSYDYVTALCMDREGALWIGTMGGGVNRFYKGSFTHYTSDNGATPDNPKITASYSGLPSNSIQALVDDGNGGVWVGTIKGLVSISGKRMTVFTKKNGLSDDNITALYRDTHGSTWIGTYNGELNRRINNKFSSIMLGPENKNKISAISEDAEGSLWVGTYRSGMFQLSNRKFRRYSKENGLPVNIVRSLMRAPNGSTWIGTVGGGLVHFKDGKVLKTYGRKEGLLDLGIWSLAAGKDGSIWFGTYGGGLHCLKNEKITAYKNKNNEAKDIVRALLMDSRDNLWVGTNGGGLEVLRSDGSKKTYNIHNGMSDNYIYSIAEDLHGTIWVGTFNGGINLFKKDGSIQILGVKDGLPPNAVWVIYPDSEGAVWLGTNDGGLCRIKNNKIDIFTTKSGLSSDTAFQILELNGDFWLNCNKGIYKVKIKDLQAFAAGSIQQIKCLSYGREEGFENVEGTGPAQPAGIVADGKIWFPTLKGVVMIEPGSGKPNTVPPPVEMERIIINDKEYKSGGEIHVPPGKGDVEFHYAGLSYLLPGKMRFKYKLDGYNKDWIEAGNRRSAFYTNLSAGYYCFRVTTCNSDGVWNQSGRIFCFHLKPHFTKTYWFYCFLFLLASFVVYMGVRFRIKSLKNREKTLQRLVEEQTRELRTANLKLAELSNLDGLTEIANRRYFDEHLKKEWRRCQRNRTPFSMLMLDVDFFKLYNDTYGHQKGDIALKSVAIILAHSISRSGDLAARYGGEEFAVILGETDLHGARVLAEKLRARVESLSINHIKSSVSQWLTISIGCTTTIPGPDNSPEQLVLTADKALYSAKHAGRNRVVSREMTDSAKQD
ncbi:MAG: diguanylate cyclase, partial [bacterium]|nr:diguanylate cyclase [bacterium]